MNTKEFRRRWVRSKIEPELFYMPIGKKEKEEFIFEVSGVNAINMYYYTGMGYTPSTPYEYVYNPLPKDKNLINHFSWNKNNYGINNINYGMIERPTTENGEEITKEKFPEYFTDFPIHDIEHGKYSENMILPKDPKVTIDWGDGNTDTYDIPQFNGASVTIDGKTTQYKYFSGYKNLYSGHKYKKAGTYIIKIKGFLPSLILPNGTTKIINWGNIGLRSIYNICTNCTSTIVDFGSPKNLEKVVTSSAIFTRQNSCVINDLSFINNMPSLVNGTQMFSYANIRRIPDNAFKNSKYLCYLSQCFYNISNEIEIGDNFAKNCINLRQIEYLFNYTKVKQIGDNAFYGCKSLYYFMYMFPTDSSKVSIESIGVNFMRGCTSLTSACYLFYYQSKLKTIGEGLLRECPNIRSAYDMFYYCNILQKVPDNLFYDLEPNTDFVRNEFCFENVFYKDTYEIYPPREYANGFTDKLETILTFVGQNMFSGKFLNNGGKIYLGYQLCNYINCYYNDACGRNIKQVSGLLSGYAPDFWNYQNSVGWLYNSNNLDSFFSIHEYMTLSGKAVVNNSFSSKSGYYGYQRGFMSLFDGWDSYQHFVNYEEIPQPKGYNIPLPYNYQQLVAENKVSMFTDNCLLLPVIFTMSVISMADMRRPLINEAKQVNGRYVNFAKLANAQTSTANCYVLKDKKVYDYSKGSTLEELSSLEYIIVPPVNSRDYQFYPDGNFYSVLSGDNAMRFKAGASLICYDAVSANLLAHYRYNNGIYALDIYEPDKNLCDGYVKKTTISVKEGEYLKRAFQTLSTSETFNFDGFYGHIKGSSATIIINATPLYYYVQFDTNSRKLITNVNESTGGGAGTSLQWNSSPFYDNLTCEIADHLRMSEYSYAESIITNNATSWAQDGTATKNYVWSMDSPIFPYLEPVENMEAHYSDVYSISIEQQESHEFIDWGDTGAFWYSADVSGQLKNTGYGTVTNLVARKNSYGQNVSLKGFEVDGDLDLLYSDLNFNRNIINFSGMTGYGNLLNDTFYTGYFPHEIMSRDEVIEYFKDKGVDFGGGN